MREFTVPPIVQLRPEDNLTDLLFRRAEADPHRAAALRRGPDGTWQEVSSRDFLAEVVSVAKGLIASGVCAGDRVGLMSKTRYEWLLLDFAIWCAGAISVPIYETSSAEQVRWILGDSAAVACVVETPQHAAAVEQVRDGLPALTSVWQLEDGAIATLRAAGADVADDVIAERRAGLRGDTVATVIYTSGTTGRPKGCELTHRNLRAEADTAVAHVHEIFDNPDATILLFLPLAHVLARAVQLMCVGGGARIAHAPDIKNLVTDLAEVRPTFILAVPRVFEKVYNGAEQKAEAAGKGKIFRAAAETAIAYSRALDAGSPALMLRLRHALFDRLVYGKLRAALGGRVEYAVSGGAPLGERLGHFYRGVGVHILEGYGLTETTAAAHVNAPKETRIGTVGKPLPGVTVRVADDGEIRFKGDIVFRGYYNNAEATAALFDDDGYLRTGDLGELSEDGYLRITGRQKEILVTSGGKNVAPAGLEDTLRAHPLISQCLVVGDGRNYITCLITLDPEALGPWLEQRNRPAASVAELVDDVDVRAAVQTAVDDANSTVSAAESIRRFVILPVDFTEANGFLTPTFKVKRTVVTERFTAEIDQMYAQKQGD